MNGDTDWYIFKGDREKHPKAIDEQLPSPPPWRDFTYHHPLEKNKPMTQNERRGSTFHPSEDECKMVNTALYLRRPLLITGKPGTGKSSLAYAVAYELALGEVLRWSITTRTTLKDGLYSYDAIGRMQDFQLSKQTEDRIGRYIRLGPLGTAFLPTKSKKPRVLLIDEIDKSDIDLPNDLLHIFEDGAFSIPELERIASEQPSVEVQTAYQDEAETETYLSSVEIEQGRVKCQQFPFVIMTSNGEREFPPAFLRRCLRLEIEQPDP